MNTGKPKVHMSAERRAEFKKLYPTPELRAEARARIKLGRPARVAAKKAAGVVNQVDAKARPGVNRNVVNYVDVWAKKATPRKAPSTPPATGSTPPARRPQNDPLKAVHDLVEGILHQKPRTPLTPEQTAARAAQAKAAQARIAKGRADLVARLTQPTRRMK